MERLRRAYLAVGFVLVPAAAAYISFVVQNWTGQAGRAEATLRAVISVGAVIWVVLWTMHRVAAGYDATVRHQLSSVVQMVEASDRDRDLQMVKVHDAIAAVREDGDRELKTSMGWVIQRFREIDPPRP